MRVQACHVSKQKILSSIFLSNPINHFFNRIHEADIGRIIGSCAVSRNLEGIINLSDNKPASQIEVAQYAYKLLGKKIPKILNYEEVYKQLSPIRRNFWENSRKIDNSLLKNLQTEDGLLEQSQVLVLL